MQRNDSLICAEENHSFERRADRHADWRENPPGVFEDLSVAHLADLSAAGGKNEMAERSVKELKQVLPPRKFVQSQVE